MFEENGDLAMVTRRERERERKRETEVKRGQKGKREREGRTSGVFGQGWNFRAGTSLKIHAA